MASGPSEYVTLVSSDGYEFLVRRENANVSGTLKRMLDPMSNFAEALSGRCVFDDISGVVLEKICEFLYYNRKHASSRDAPAMDIPPELCLELLVAADYLNHSEMNEFMPTAVLFTYIDAALSRKNTLQQ